MLNQADLCMCMIISDSEVSFASALETTFIRVLYMPTVFLPLL